MEDFYDILIGLLQTDERFFAEDGTFLRNVAVEAAMTMDEQLIELLLSNPETYDRFFTEAAGIVVFDKTQFAWTINNRQFLPDSYTRFKNKIGLGDENENMISSSGDVKMLFPYKDCVLEGGQTKEDQHRNEVFYNETLAPDKIDRLLFPKVFTGALRYSQDGVEEVAEVREGDNFVIKGNNLLSISSLLKRFEGKIRLIYLDPPYNTKNDSFNYNDTFKLSTYLTFMKNRLEIAKRLLSADGSIYVQLDNNAVHYVKVLMDEIFGRDCFQREIIWDTTVLSGYKTMTNNWIRGHDSILFYSKQPKGFVFNKQRMPHRKEYLDRFDKVDENGRRYFDGRGERRYLDETIDKGKAVGDVWYDIMSFQQIPTAKEKVDFDTQKPEALLRRIIQAATNEGDYVLDFFAGTGTTGVVAHKLNRRYILCEQIDSQIELQLGRLSAVVNGEDPGALANELGWHGGGSFIYMELEKLNQILVERIGGATDKSELDFIYRQMLASGFISYRVDPRAVDENIDDYNELPFEDKQRFLMEILDKNLLYVNYCDIDDDEFGVSEEDKAFTKSFYGEG